MIDTRIPMPPAFRKDLVGGQSPSQTMPPEEQQGNKPSHLMGLREKIGTALENLRQRVQLPPELPAAYDSVRRLFQSSPVVSPLPTSTPMPTPTPQWRVREVLNRQTGQFERVPVDQGPPPAVKGVTSMPTPTPTPMPPFRSEGTGRDPSIGNYPITPEVRSALSTAATAYKVPISLLYDIAKSESSFDPNNPGPKGARDEKTGEVLNPIGLFQFTDKTWNDVLTRYNDKPGMSLHLPTTDRRDPLTNALAAAYLIKFGQLGRWKASKESWGKFYKPQELQPYYSQTLSYQGR